MKAKKFLVLVLTLILIIGAVPFSVLTVNAEETIYNGWYQEGEKWKYYENGTLVTDRWVKDSIDMVYIGFDGYMVTDKWLKDSEGWCYVGPYGYRLKNCWQKDSKGWCYLDENGRITVDKWVYADENWFYVDKNGYRISNTLLEYKGKYYYLNEVGVMHTGWLELDNARYYFNSGGDAQIGWAIIEDEKYLFDDKGKCVEGANKFVIDISKWQGNIEWDLLANTGIDGVILRSSYGGQSLESKNDSKDIRFDEYVDNLNRLNIPYGVYHFNTATTVEKAKIQAQNVVAILKESKANLTLPVFVDIETDGGKCDLISIAKVYISTFIANGYMPGIYANEDYWNNYLNSKDFDPYYKWIANYGKDNGNASSYFSPDNGIENYMMWQYTSKGVLNGITENTVDLNALFSWYLKPDGWNEISGKKYYYSNGYLTYGWFEEDGLWYNFGDTGAMLTDTWCRDSKGWCYMGADGYMITNEWIKHEGKWYHLDANGYKESNKWVKDSKGWVYLSDDGAMLTNSWCSDSSGLCYVGANGYAVTNCWKKNNVGWIYLNSNGSMTKNTWLLDGDKWYHFDLNGYMESNKWIKDSVGWVYLSKDGSMLTDSWCTDSSGWCYVGSNGYALTNCWKRDSIGWIWLNSEGSMAKSKWVQDGANWYYLNANGYMVHSTTININGIKYTFNSSGAWIG